jgi:hypothetical protein
MVVNPNGQVSSLNQGYEPTCPTPDLHDNPAPINEPKTKPSNSPPPYSFAVKNYP